MTSQSSGGEPPMRQPGISRTLRRSVQVSIPQAVESCKVEIAAILKDTVWPRRSTDTARDLRQTIENAQNLNNIPNDENLIRAEYRASLEQFIRIMEGVRGRLSKASNKYGAKERSFGSRTKYLFTYLDRDQCTEILESCHNEMKNALGSLPDRWNLEDEEAGGVGDGELEGTRTFGIQPATVHVGDVFPAVSADNTSNPRISSAPQPPGSQSAATVSSNNQNQQPAALDEQPHANPRRREWLGTLKTTFDVVEGVSGMIPVVGTYVGSAAKVGATLVEMVQGMGSNEEAAKDLESRALELSNILKHFNDESVEKRKDDLTKYINDLQRELQSVQREVERLDSSGVFKKVFASSDRAESLKGYQETIRTALEQIQLLATLNTSSLVTELYDKEAAKEQRRLLKVLGDANYGARGDAIEDVTCLEGTRVQILSRIDDWIRDAATSERALWLHGMAGRGKSTIASTVANRWTDRAACAIFHFRRGQNTLDRRLVCALARQLCSNGLVPELKESILKSVEENEDIVQDRLQGQFKALLVDPLARFRRNPVPILLIVDALDECQDINYAVRFVELIDQNSSRFPSNVKFLLTSRPEAQLIRALEPRQWHAENLDTTADVAEDVERYLRVGFSRLRPVGQAPGTWPRSEDVAALVERSQGLFQWAYTAMEYIKRGLAEERLKWLLTSPETYAGLDSLYLQIFTQALNKAKESPVGEQPLLYMLSALVTAPHPISLDIFAFLSADLPSFQGKDHDTIVQLLRSEVLVNLGSVIHVPDTSGDSIRLMHTSVRDLLVNEERCGGEPYSVNVASSHRYLAFKCLQLMKRDLKHNICHLSNLSKANSDTDIQERVKLHVPKGLPYCCRSWSIHLMAGTMGPPLDGQQILADIGGLSKEKVLEWLEVMSLIGETRESMTIARQMHSWLQERSDTVDPLLTALWSDVHRLITFFYEPIAFGALHIYASALPLCPVNTSLWKHNGSCATTRVLNGPRDTIWPSSVWSRQASAGVTFIAFMPHNGVIVCGSDDGAIQFWDNESGVCVGQPLRGHDHWSKVTAVAFSPNAKLIASASWDETIQLWDAESGAPVGEPLRGHDEAVKAIAFSPNGKLLASASYDKTIQLWDAESKAPVGEPLRGHDWPVDAVAFSPDGKLLASGSTDNTARLWDAESGAPVGEPLRGHIGSVNTIVFSPNGKFLASGSSDTTIQLWNAKSGVPVGEPLRGHDGAVIDVAFSPNGKLLASASYDKTIQLWDAESGAPIGEPLRGHDNSVRAVAFSPNSKLLASGSNDGTFRLWDAESQASVQEPLRGHDKAVKAIAFSPNGKLLASASYDKTIQLWDAESKAPVGEPLRGHDDWVRAVAFSPNGKLLASGSCDKTIQLWDAESGTPVGEPLRGHNDWVRAVAFSSNGKLFASGSDDRTIQLWDAESGAPVREPLRGHDGAVNAVAFSPDGKLLASGSDDQTIRLWDAGSGAPIGEPLRGHSEPVDAVAFSPNGNLLASGSCDKTIQLWDVKAGAPIGEPLRGHSGAVNAVAFSPNGKLLASGSDDNITQLWDAESGAPVNKPLRGHDGAVNAVAFSPNGKLFASGSDDKAIRLWDVESGAPVGEPLKGHHLVVNAVAFSPNGKLLASSSDDKTIQLWNTKSGVPVGEPLRGHDGAVNAVAFSLNGKLLASGSNDKTIQLWDAKSGAPIGEPLRGHDNSVRAVAFSPNSKLLASESNDGTFRLWDAESRAPVWEPLLDYDQTPGTGIPFGNMAFFMLQHYSNPYSTPLPSSGQHSLGFQGQWVTFLSNNFLWLPHKYWGPSTPIIVLSHGTLAFASGPFVYFFDVSPALNMSQTE